VLKAEETACPACNREQSSTKEWIAIALMIVVIVVTFWFHTTDPLAKDDTEQAANSSSPHHSSKDQKPSTGGYEPPHSSQQANLFESLAQSHRTPVTPKAPSQSSGARTSTATTTQFKSYQNSRFQQRTDQTFPFYVAEKKWNSKTKRYDFYRVGMEGSERVLKIDARRYFLSENQSNYPTPQSGCGPTALLNLYVWYSKFGLIQESVKHSDPIRYKQNKFAQIDRKIAEIQGQARSPINGTNILENVIAIDELVQADSRAPIRMHFEYATPPLNTKDFTNLSRNYRAGILTVRPKDPTTGRLMGNHAVLVIRGDTSGKISIANWGDFSHGSLVQKADGQWFIPDDPTQHELRINRLTTLIPFTPKA
jgi:hypothetical protein